MDAFQAIVLGLIQGLTEFLPISSSGHLFLLPLVFHWDDGGPAFTAVIQLGTIIAVLWYFRSDLKRILTTWIQSFTKKELKSENDVRLAWAIVVGTIPILVFGKLFENSIESTFRSAIIVASTLIVFGIVLFFAERFAKQTRKIEEVTIKDGLKLGLWQSLALIPGSSRSGCTISGGLISNFDRFAAARISFLLSIPAIVISGLYELFKERAVLLDRGLVPTLLATVIAFASGLWAITFLMKYLQTKSTNFFVYYRIVLGLIILGLVLSGRIPNKPAQNQMAHHKYGIHKAV